ncbi:MAG: hypothetical protein ACRD1B_08270 [Thermoanaerobaculia bacterium]
MKWSERLEGPVLTLHLLALVMAIGPPVFFGLAVAPAAFRVLPTRDLAASLTSPILTTACGFAQGSFAMLFLTSWLLFRRWQAPRLSRSLATRAAILGMIAAVVVEKLLIPRMDRIRAETPGLIDNLPAADPSRLLLARDHRLATAFFCAQIAAALIILFLTARSLVRRRLESSPAPSRPPVPKLLDLSDV